MKDKLAYCKVNISPVRLSNQEQSEMVTQLLFGEIAEVSEITGNWCKITTHSDNYEGWIDVRHIGFLSSKEVQRWLDERMPETKLLRQIITPWGSQWLSRGAYLPSSKNGSFNIGNDQFFYFDQPFSKRYLDSVEVAQDYLNTPYLWGGKNPFGIDCSGLVQMAYRFLDINLPRNASQQKEYGREIKFEDAEPNDLAFFVNEKGNVTHVGIVMPEQKIIHASGQVRIDSLRPEGIFNEEQKLVTHKLYSLRRL
jgi:hypothetical protein